MERGARAEALLRDELLIEAFGTLKAEYLTGWEATAARDTDARERLWLAVQVLGKVWTHLEQVAADGRVATRELNDTK